jgi:hypothetical protein
MWGTRCKECGFEDMGETEVENYDYLQSGLSNVVLLNGAHSYNCPECEDEYINLPDEAGLLGTIGTVLLKTLRPLKGVELKFLRSNSGLTQADLVSLVRGIEKQPSVARWETQGEDKFFEAGRVEDEYLLRMILLERFSRHAKSTEAGLLSVSPQQRYDLDRFGDESSAFFRKLRTPEVNRERNKLIFRFEGIDGKDNFWHFESDNQKSYPIFSVET